MPNGERRRRVRREYSLPEGGTITGTGLRRARKETQVEVMRAWFHQHYTDPVENTPYESAEGGYQYIWGGPYEPREELESEFGTVVRDSAIEELAEELRRITYECTGNPDEQEQSWDDLLLDVSSLFGEHLGEFHNSMEKDFAGPRESAQYRIVIEACDRDPVPVYRVQERARGYDL